MTRFLQSFLAFLLLSTRALVIGMAPATPASINKANLYFAFTAYSSDCGYVYASPDVGALRERQFDGRVRFADSCLPTALTCQL